MNRERKDELTELDLELAKMAQETPEMPADFHARWTEAVRAEAAGQTKIREFTLCHTIKCQAVPA